MRLRGVLWGAAFAIVLLPSAVAAQTLTDAERSGRVAILMRADEARRANHFEEALSLIQQAEEIGPTGGTRMLSAQVLSQMGRYAAAHAAASQCVREVDLDTQTSTANRRALRETCERYRDEALPHVVRLTVHVPSSAPTAMVVHINEAVLRAPLYNIEQIVDSRGSVTVRATLGGGSPWQQSVTLTAGASVAVDVEVPSGTAPAATSRPPLAAPTPPVLSVTPGVPPVTAQPTETQAPHPTAASPASTQRVLAWVSGALGLAVVGGAAVSGAMFISQRDAYDRGLRGADRDARLLVSIRQPRHVQRAPVCGLHRRRGAGGRVRALRHGAARAAVPRR